MDADEIDARTPMARAQGRSAARNLRRESGVGQHRPRGPRQLRIARHVSAFPLPRRRQGPSARAHATTVRAMDWSDAVVPLVVAVVGVVAVAVGAGVAARSSLRVRLIEMEREEDRDHRDFQIRTVAAVNALGTATAHLIRARLTFLRALRDEARARMSESGDPTQIAMPGPFNLSPSEDARVASATDQWRSILAEGHAFASAGTGNALEAFDQRRAELVTAVNEATLEPDISDSIRGLEAADLLCTDLRVHYGRQIYRHLQVAKLAASARVFHLAHVWRLGAFTRQVANMHHADIDAAQDLIARNTAEHDKPV